MIHASGSCGAWPGRAVSGGVLPLTVVFPGLENTGSVTAACGFSCPVGVRDLPGAGVKPLPPALAGGSFTTEAPGKPAPLLIWNLNGTRIMRLSRQLSATSSPQALVWTKPCPIRHPSARPPQVARTLVTHCRDRRGCFPDPVLPDNLLLVECLRASPKGFTGPVLLVGPHACAAPVKLLGTKIAVLWV